MTNFFPNIQPRMIDDHWFRQDKLLDDEQLLQLLEADHAREQQEQMFRFVDPDWLPRPARLRGAIGNPDELDDGPDDGPGGNHDDDSHGSQSDGSDDESGDDASMQQQQDSASYHVVPFSAPRFNPGPARRRLEDAFDEAVSGYNNDEDDDEDSSDDSTSTNRTQTLFDSSAQTSSGNRTEIEAERESNLNEILEVIEGRRTRTRSSSSESADDSSSDRKFENRSLARFASESSSSSSSDTSVIEIELNEEELQKLNLSICGSSASARLNSTKLIEFLCERANLHGRSPVVLEIASCSDLRTPSPSQNAPRPQQLQQTPFLLKRPTGSRLLRSLASPILLCGPPALDRPFPDRPAPDKVKSVKQQLFAQTDFRFCSTSSPAATASGLLRSPVSPIVSVRGLISNVGDTSEAKGQGQGEKKSEGEEKLEGEEKSEGEEKPEGEEKLEGEGEETRVSKVLCTSCISPTAQAQSSTVLSIRNQTPGSKLWASFGSLNVLDPIGETLSQLLESSKFVEMSKPSGEDEEKDSPWQTSTSYIHWPEIENNCTPKAEPGSCMPKASKLDFSHLDG